MHQTSEGHDSTRFSSFPHLDRPNLLSHASCTQHSRSTHSAVSGKPLRRLEIGGMALEHSNVACSISVSRHSALRHLKGSCDRRGM
jgi:hypothetical protein